MTRRIKILFGSIVLALGFLFCVVGLSVNAKAEAEQPTTDETQEVVNEEVTETTEQEEEQEEVVEDKEEKSLLETAEFIIKFLQNTNIESVKTRFYSLLAGLGIDFTLLGILIVWLIKLKVKQFRSSENWQELKAKLDVKHQQEMEQKADEYEEKLDEVKNILLEQIKSLDDEKKKVAANNIALLKDNLQDIKEDLEK